MDKLQQMLAEALNEGDSKYKKKAISAIYDEVNKKKLTSKKFSDSNWNAVDHLIAVIGSVSPYVKKVETTVKDGGYRRNKHGEESKEYNLTIFLDDGTICSGLITCFPAGTVSDIWKSYDMTLQLW